MVKCNGGRNSNCRLFFHIDCGMENGSITIIDKMIKSSLCHMHTTGNEIDGNEAAPIKNEEGAHTNLSAAMENLTIFEVTEPPAHDVNEDEGAVGFDYNQKEEKSILEDIIKIEFKLEDPLNLIVCSTPMKENLSDNVIVIEDDDSVEFIGEF